MTSIVPTKYAVILDAGSSGTRIYIYEWKEWAGSQDCNCCTKETPCNFPYDNPWVEGDCPRNAPPPHINEVYNWKKKGGLAKVSPGGVSAYLEDLLDRARLFLGRGVNRTTTPLFVLGTAGIRDLDDDRRETLLKEVRRYTNKAGFSQDAECKDISGDEEALYGWLAANYLSENFTAEGIAKDNSFGYLEMGGASAQIAFRPVQEEIGLGETNKEGIKEYTGKLARMKLGSRNYYVFTKSDRLGADKAWRHHEAALLTKIPAVVEDPCLPSGFSLIKQDKTIKGTKSLTTKITAKIYGLAKDYIDKTAAEKITSAITYEIEGAVENILQSDNEEVRRTAGKEIADKAANVLVQRLQKEFSVDFAEPMTPESFTEEISKTIAELVDEAIGVSISPKYKHCEDATLQLLRYLSSTEDDPIYSPCPNCNDGNGPVDLLPNGPYINFGDRRFLGGAQFWYTTHEIFGLDSDGEPKTDYDFKRFQDEVLRLAEKNWADMKRAMPSVEEEYLQKSLFMAAWITNVLKGFKFPLGEKPLTLKPYNGRRAPGSCELTWTLGKIILLSVNYKYEYLDVKNIPLEQIPTEQSYSES